MVVELILMEKLLLLLHWRRFHVSSVCVCVCERVSNMNEKVNGEMFLHEHAKA